MKLKASQLAMLIAFSIDNKFPLLIKAKPGVGKSDIVGQCAARAGVDTILTHPVVSDPTDYKGMPYVSSGKADFLPFGDLRALIEAKRTTMCFIDDLGQASASVQAALMQVILARKINGHAISDHVVFIAATNRKEDKAAVSGLLEPVKSRFVSIVELEVDTNDWCKWALSIGNMPTELVAFIRYRPELLDDFKPTKDIINSPSPRTVANVGKLHAAGIPDSLRFAAFGGAAGEGFATEYVSFLDIYKNLPNLDQIFLNPDSVDVPNQPAVLYAISGAIAGRITDVNASNAFKYIDRLPLEIGVATVKDATHRNPALHDTRACIEWQVNKGDDILS